MTDVTKQILDAVDAGWEDQIAFMRDLIRYPSLRGQEHTAQEFVFGALRGVETKWNAEKGNHR